MAELVDAAGLESVALSSEFAGSNPAGVIHRMGTITHMAKKPNKPDPDRVKFEGDWEDLAGKMVKPAPKPEPRETKKRKPRKPK